MSVWKKIVTAKATGLLGFLVFQAVLVAVALAATTRRVQQLDTVGRLPTPRNVPLRVEPTYDYPWVVTDEQLQSVLFKLRPRLRGKNPKINHVDHALRFWGVEAEFDDPQCLSGQEMRQLLLDHSRFQAAWGEKTPALVVDSPRGVRVRTCEGFATASHVDHTLAGLAEVGTPLDYPVQTPVGQTTYRSMLRQSLRSFRLNQAEYEWSALAYALTLPSKNGPHETGWYTNENQHMTFDRLAERMMRQRYSQGVCLGNHRLHALVMLLRVDDQNPILQTETRTRIVSHLREATRRLANSLSDEGYWGRNWAGDRPGHRDEEDSQADRILATGHALEWWALAPQEVHPPREVLVRAGQWLVREIDGLDRESVKKHYTYLSHAGRALALWRGKFPAEFLESQTQPQ